MSLSSGFHRAHSGLRPGERLLFLFTQGIPHLIMLGIGFRLLYLAVRKEIEPLLLLPIAFGCIIVNLPFSEVMDQGGFLRFFYDVGIKTEIFPLLIFIGIGGMTDFGPLLENPTTLLLGAAGQFGIFLTLLLALALGFPKLDAMYNGIIGVCDGPTAKYVTSEYAPHLLGSVSVAAYSYSLLVPLIQPPIMRALTSREERTTRMAAAPSSVSRSARIVFPVLVTIVNGLIAPKGLPLMATIMLGNLMKESGVVTRLAGASEHEISNVVTLLLALTIGGTMEGHAFLKPPTLAVFALGFIAICFDTAAGVLFGKLLYRLSGKRINPLIGAAGISAYPMAARVVQVEGSLHDRKNYLLMHAMGANTGGQIGSIVTAAIMLSLVQSMGLH